MTSALLAELQSQVGQTFQSEWLLIDQAMIDRFAEVTGDFPYTHVDPERAAQTPCGGTVAHGFLSLALLSRLHATLRPLPIEGIRMGINYGLDRVRFIHPVRSGSRVRAVTTIAAIEEKRPGQFQQTLNVTVEIEGVKKPALTAVWINQFLV